MDRPGAARMREFLEQVVAAPEGPRWRAFRLAVTAGLAVAVAGCGGRVAADGGGRLSTGGTAQGGAPSMGGDTATGGDDVWTGGAILYGLVLEEGDCANGLDDDGDGAVDCDDPDCAGGYPCVSVPPYGMPFPYESDCANGLDDDGDGNADCADQDCLEAPGCPCCIYAAPM